MFGIVYKCHRAKNRGSVLTEEGTEVLVCKTDHILFTALPVKKHFGEYREFTPNEAMLFETRKEAEEFYENHVKDGGHPWYYKCNGEYHINELEEVRRVTGYKVVKW